MASFVVAATAAFAAQPPRAAQQEPEPEPSSSDPDEIARRIAAIESRYRDIRYAERDLADSPEKLGELRELLDGCLADATPEGRSAVGPDASRILDLSLFYATRGLLSRTDGSIPPGERNEHLDIHTRAALRLEVFQRALAASFELAGSLTEDGDLVDARELLETVLATPAGAQSSATNHLLLLA